MNEKKNDYKYPEVNQDTPWPSIEFPYVEGQPIIVMIAGFPDHCTSGFGKVLDELLRAEKYHIICLCLPDFQSNCQKPKPWGYSPIELLSLLRQTIQHYVKDDKQKISLIVHDWGSYFGILYENAYKDSVERLVLLDVGVGINENIKTYLVLIFYQFYFSTSYILSQIFGKTIGTLFLATFFIFKFDKFFGPCPHEGKLNRPRKEVTAHLCYIYYSFWKMMLTNTNVLIPKNPSCPVLFMYGKKKRIFFHNKEFIEHLNSLGYPNRHISYDAGHWFHTIFFKEVFEEIQAFIPGQSKKRNTHENKTDEDKSNGTFIPNFLWKL